MLILVSYFKFKITKKHLKFTFLIFLKHVKIDELAINCKLFVIITTCKYKIS